MKKLIDSMIDQAQVKAGELAEHLKAGGQVALPQLLAKENWTNGKGEEFRLIIMLKLLRSDVGRQIGLTSFRIHTIYDGMFVTDYYVMSGSFADNISSDEFRKKTERFVMRLKNDDGSKMKTKINNQGVNAIRVLEVPDSVQMDFGRLPADCTLSIFGKIFEGIETIKDYWRNQTDSSRPYIIERSERFPCFDSSDYAYENRYFWNFLICRSKREADRKAKDLAQLQVVGGNFRLVSENLPTNMRPMVYFEDESTSMLLAY